MRPCPKFWHCVQIRLASSGQLNGRGLLLLLSEAGSLLAGPDSSRLGRTDRKLSWATLLAVAGSMASRSASYRRTVSTYDPYALWHPIQS